MFFKKQKILSEDKSVRLKRAYSAMKSAIKREMGSDGDHEAAFTLSVLFAINTITGNYHLTPEESENNALIFYEQIMESITDMATAKAEVK